MFYPSISRFNQSDSDRTIMKGYRRVAIVEDYWDILEQIHDLCNGNNPITLSYDQSQMRSHLLAGLVAMNITPFPRHTNRHRKITKVKDHIEVLPIFCTCRLPDDGKIMIQCAMCKEWYHRTCLSQLSDEFFEKDDLVWICYSCQ